jgi:hypothetical protein
MPLRQQKQLRDEMVFFFFPFPLFFPFPTLGFIPVLKPTALPQDRFERQDLLNGMRATEQPANATSHLEFVGGGAAIGRIDRQI